MPGTTEPNDTITMPATLQDIEDLHARSCQNNQMTYQDPNTGLTVFTSLSHTERGSCCGCGCRHCPWQSKKTTTTVSCRPKRKTTATTVPTTTTTTTTKRKNRVYTKTGDKGTSSLFTGQRVPKDDVVFEALGTIDELNSAVGHSYSQLHHEAPHHPLLPFLLRTMKILLSLGSPVATPPETATARQLARAQFDTTHTHVRTVEGWIDRLTAALPDLRTFVLPFGGNSCASLHVCRSLCRRCERRVIAVSGT